MPRGGFGVVVVVVVGLPRTTLQAVHLFVVVHAHVSHQYQHETESDGVPAKLTSLVYPKEYVRVSTAMYVKLRVVYHDRVDERMTKDA